MKILVLSDSHGAVCSMQDIYRFENCNAVIFLGDTVRDAEQLALITGGVPVYRVKGNCDMFMCDAPDEQLLILGGKRIFITHGHKYGVKSGLMRLCLAGREKNADIVLFGHTHSQFIDDGDMLILNPGSVSGGKYAVVEITDKVKAELKKL